MRILLINSVYKVGSTGKIVDGIATSLRECGHEAFTCYGIGDTYYDDYSQKICSVIEHKFNAFLMRIRGIPYGGLFFSNWRFQKVIKQFRPDVVHVHCINASMINVYSLLKYLAKNHIKTVMTLHAEIFYTAGCEHAFDCEKFKTFCYNCRLHRQKAVFGLFDRSKTAWLKMYDSFRSFQQEDIILTAVSPWLAKRAQQSTILKNYKILYVPNGVDTNVFHFNDNVGLIDKGKYEKIVLFVAPRFSLEANDVKGGRFLPRIAEMLPNYIFVVVVSRFAKQLDEMPPNVYLWGSAKNQEELAQLYSEADVTLLLSRRETFSMVTAESLCCGTPVVGFKAGGPESIAIKDYCSFVENGDIKHLVDKLNGLQKSNKQEISQRATVFYAEKYMTERYLKIFTNLACFQSES